MRLFIAINLSEQTKILLVSKVALLKKGIERELKWVDEDKWHLTLRFLGETEENRITSIEKVITDLVSKFQQTRLQFNEINLFPDLNKPRVITVNTGKGSNEIISIRNELELKLTETGFTAENRPFVPHLTLARTRRNTDVHKIVSRLKRYMGSQFINIYIEVKKISLMKSTLLQEGPVYEEVFSADLIKKRKK
jgi:RNA 2',3'-cyclic 3'-phosphodiesterase